MEYPRSFVLGGKKNLQGGKGKGIRKEKKKKKKLGEKLKEKKRKKWKGEKRKQHGREGESNRRCASISVKSPMPYPSPTVTLKLHCEQFWTFIVIVTFDLLRTLLRMRAYEPTNKDNYIIDCIDYVTGIGNVIQAPPHSVLHFQWAAQLLGSASRPPTFDTSTVAISVCPRAWLKL